MSTQDLIARAKAERAARLAASNSANAAAGTASARFGPPSIGAQSRISAASSRIGGPAQQNAAAAATAPAAGRATAQSRTTSGGTAAAKGGGTAAGITVDDLQRVIDQQTQRGRERDADHKAELREREKLWESTAAHLMVQLQSARRGAGVGAPAVSFAATPAGAASNSANNVSAVLDAGGAVNNRKKPHRKFKYDGLPEASDVDGDDDAAAASQKAKGSNNGGGDLIGIPAILMSGNRSEQIVGLARAHQELIVRQDKLERKLVAMARKPGRPPSSKASTSAKGSVAAASSAASADDDADDDGDDDDAGDDDAGTASDQKSSTQVVKARKRATPAPKKKAGAKRSTKKGADDDDDDDSALEFDDIPFSQLSAANRFSMPTISVKDFVDDPSALAPKRKKDVTSNVIIEPAAPRPQAKPAAAGRRAVASSAAAPDSASAVPSEAGKRRQRTEPEPVSKPKITVLGPDSTPSTSSSASLREQLQHAAPSSVVRNPLLQVIAPGSRFAATVGNGMQFKQQLASCSDDGSSISLGAATALVHLFVSHHATAASTPEHAASFDVLAAPETQRSLVDALRAAGALENAIAAAREFVDQLLASPPDEHYLGALPSSSSSSSSSPSSASAALSQQESTAAQHQVRVCHCFGAFLGAALAALSPESGRAAARAALLDTLAATLGSMLRVRSGTAEAARRAAAWVAFASRLVCGAGGRGGQLMPSLAAGARRDTLALAIEICAHFVFAEAAAGAPSAPLQRQWEALCNELEWPERMPPLPRTAHTLLGACAERLRTRAHGGAADAAVGLILAFRLLSLVVTMTAGFDQVMGAVQLQAGDASSGDDAAGARLTQWHVARGCVVGFLVSDFSLTFATDLQQSPSLIAAMRAVMRITQKPGTDALLDFSRLVICNAVLHRDKADVTRATTGGDLVTLCIEYSAAAAAASSRGGGSSAGSPFVASSLQAQVVAAMTFFANS